MRLQHLTPIPCGATLDAISATLVARLDDQLGLRRDGTDQTIGALWTEEQPRLLALPAAAAPRLVSVSPVAGPSGRRGLLHAFTLGWPRRER